MYRRLFNLQSYQCLALAFCLLLLNQQVVRGKVENRRQYESAFDNLFEKGKDAVKQLSSFHVIVRDEKVLRQNTDKVMDFVKANPDKVGIGIGLAASSWLLYQSIHLGSEIERFFDEIEELNGQFKEYSQLEIPRLEELYHRAREVTDYAELEKQKVYLNDVHDELIKYYDALERILDIVGDVIEDVNNGKTDAVINTALSGTIAVLAGAAIVGGGPVAMPPVIWKAGVLATMGTSMASTTMSLKNAHDLTKASERLTTLKHNLRRLRKQVMEKMKKVAWIIREIADKNIDENSFLKGILVGLLTFFVISLLRWSM